MLQNEYQAENEAFLKRIPNHFLHISVQSEQATIKKELERWLLQVNFLYFISLRLFEHRLSI